MGKIILVIIACMAGYLYYDTVSMDCNTMDASCFDNKQDKELVEKFNKRMKFENYIPQMDLFAMYVGFHKAEIIKLTRDLTPSLRYKKTVRFFKEKGLIDTSIMSDFSNMFNSPVIDDEGYLVSGISECFKVPSRFQCDNNKIKIKVFK
jgi:hypothetical protein